MLAVSVVHVVVYSLVVSGVLIWLKIRGVGPVGAAAGTIVACVAVGIIQFFVSGQTVVSRQAVQFWLCFVLLPGAVVFGMSRLGWLRNSPWWLLLLGPLSFVLGVVLGMVTYNVLFALRQAR
jgi:hypothetical protein